MIESIVKTGNENNGMKQECDDRGIIRSEVS